MVKTAFVGTEDALTEKIIGVFYQVFNELGYGFLSRFIVGQWPLRWSKADCR